MYNISKPN